MKVLVAEDDLASGKFMQKLLSKYGEVVLARDGIAAVDEFVNAVSTNERFDHCLQSAPIVPLPRSGAPASVLLR